MGVHPAGGPEHGPLRPQARLPEALKGLLRRHVGGLLADGCGPLQVGQEGGGAVQKGEHVHVLVAAVVVPVHQPRLGGGAHLVQQCPGSLGGQELPVLFREKVPQDGPGFSLDLLHRVEPPGGAALARLPAHQTGPGREPQGLPVPLAPLWVQHVQVEQAAQGVPVLDPGAQLLDSPGGAVHGPKGLAPGGPVHLLLVEGAQPPSGQSVLQAEEPLPEGPADHRAVFDGACDVQGKGDHRAAVPVQQLPLTVGPALPGLQHLHQSHFPLHLGPPYFQ